MTGRGVTLVAVAFMGCVLSQGCASRVRDPTTGVEAKYRWDVLEARVDRSIWEVYAAAQKAVKELQLRVTYERVDGLAGKIRAVDAYLDSVCVETGALPRCRTELKISIGLWGDKCKSIVLFENIMARLGAAQEATTAALRPGEEGPAESSGEF